MGLSRNKVAVPEGVAGTPPFWSVSDGTTPGGTREYEYFQSFVLYSAHSCEVRLLPLRSEIIDNTERKDQRGKEKQKEKSVLI